MSKKSKTQTKKESLQKKAEELEQKLTDLEKKIDNAWNIRLEKLQVKQVEKLKFLEMKLDKGIAALESTKKKVRDVGASGYYSCHHDVMEACNSVYSASAHLSELKMIEVSIKEIIRKDAKKDSPLK